MFRMLAVFLLIILSGCIQNTDYKKVEIITNQEEIKLNLEVADTFEEMSRGLMFRQKLGESEGMIFVFDKEKMTSFWMKNTLIPLDMIFVSENGTINEIKVDVQPCYQDPCETYPSKYPSKFVIELNANYTVKKNINVGDFVKIN
ncbi:MAG: DUF192 domain-containing protein [Candidatus Aenigmatarchaeota archaeon]|nr:DUF192 domain-containing protein [Candidatus Aenigmarchaeota archaeon]